MELPINERIRKLLELAVNNSNPNESQAAFLKAQQLMAEQYLSKAPPPNHGAQLSQPTVETWIWLDPEPEPWERRLAWALAVNLRCKTIWLKKNGMRFYGLSEDLTICKAVFESAHQAALTQVARFLSNEHRKWKPEVLAKREASMRKFPITSSERYQVKKSFLDGFVQGLTEKYKKQVEEMSLALVIVAPSTVEDHYTRMHPDARQTKSRERVRLLEGTKQVGVARGRSFKEK